MISMDKKYKYRNGEPARILCVDANGSYPVVSLNEEGSVIFHNKDGAIGEEYRWDLIEDTKYADFKDNEEVVCWNWNGSKVKRHFAYEVGGKAFCYADGKSKWSSAIGETASWNNCVKASEFDGEL